MGRKRKYTAKALERAVNKYFRRISRYVPVYETVETDELDAYGHKVKIKIPVKNQLGEEVQALEYILPPTEAGLCEYLGIHRSTWYNWQDGERYPEYIDIVTRAGGRMRAYLQERLLLHKSVRGIELELKNNFGYGDKREIEITQTNPLAELSNLSLDERLELIKSVYEDITSDD